MHHHKQVSLHFEPSSPFYGQFRVQKCPFLAAFRTIVLKVQDDHRCAEYVFPMGTVVLS